MERGQRLLVDKLGQARYFGIKLGDELRAVVEGRRTRDEALRSYASFVDRHQWKFRSMLWAQRLVPKLPARVQRAVIRACGRKRFVDWAFKHYLRIAPPEFAHSLPPARENHGRVAAAA